MPTQPSTDRIRAFFHEYAADFDALYGTRRNLVNRVLNPLLRRSMKLRFAATMAGCEPVAGCTVLNVGCGPGHYEIELARRGAAKVVGIDFAPGMLEIARARVEEAGHAARCEFICTGFEEFAPGCSFDHVVLTGFMDYMDDPQAVVDKALSLTRRRAFFSFPAAGGLLAWQRQLRYRRRCELFLYTREQVERLFRRGPSIELRKLGRDFFVRVDMSS